MAKKTDSVEIIDIKKFFSKNNEENGKWYEPTVKGMKVGFEFKVYGPNSNASIIADDKFRKEVEQIETIEDETEKQNRYKAAVAKKVTAYVCDIRASNGKEITIDGEDVSKEDIFEIFINSPVIATDILRFAQRQENFLD